MIRGIILKALSTDWMHYLGSSFPHTPFLSEGGDFRVHPIVKDGFCYGNKNVCLESTEKRATWLFSSNPPPGVRHYDLIDVFSFVELLNFYNLNEILVFCFCEMRKHFSTTQKVVWAQKTCFIERVVATKSLDPDSSLWRGWVRKTRFRWNGMNSCHIKYLQEYYIIYIY